MISYINNKRGFLKDFHKGHITSWLEKEVGNLYAGNNQEDNVSDSELASWQNTLPYMALILNDNRISDNAEIAFEYVLEIEDSEHKYRRVDVMLFGKGINGKDNIIMLEFKQYSNISYDENLRDNPFKTVFFGKTRYHKNPSEQLNNYCQIINSYNSAISSGQIKIYKAVCMLNLDKDSKENKNNTALDYINDRSLIDKVFYEGQINELKEYVTKKIGSRSRESVFIKFAKGEPVATSDFYTTVSDFFRNDDIALRKDQSDCFDELVTRIDAKLEDTDNSTKTFVVEGGPGSGKSILALKLFRKYLQENRSVCYIPSGSALMDTVKEALPEEYFSNIFYINEYVESDIIILDEAHRCQKIELKHIYQSNPPKVIIAFFDDKQRYRKKSIQKHDLNYNEEDHFILRSQYRCGGDKGYLEWLDSKLYGENYPFDRKSIYFDFGVISSPAELKRQAGKPNTIVLVGPSKLDEELRFDTELLETVVNSYNELRTAENLNNAFTLKHWINGTNHYGDINNIQGIEAENVIVILGNEFCVRDGHLECREEMFNDKYARNNFLSITSTRPLKAEESSSLNAYVKNIYRILLTRGLKSCRVYSTNREIQRLFKR